MSKVENRNESDLLNYLLAASVTYDETLFFYARDLGVDFSFTGKDYLGRYILDLSWSARTFEYLSFLMECVSKKDEFGDFVFKNNSSLDEYLGIDDHFHSRNIEGITLLQFIDENMSKEKEIFLDILVKVDEFKGNNESTREERINQQLKLGLPSSPRLADLIETLSMLWYDAEVKQFIRVLSTE